MISDADIDRYIKAKIKKIVWGEWSFVFGLIVIAIAFALSARFGWDREPGWGLVAIGWLIYMGLAAGKLSRDGS